MDINYPWASNSFRANLSFQVRSLRALASRYPPLRRTAQFGAELGLDTGVKPKVHERSTDRVRVAVPARLTWKDASGAVRFASVVTRDVSAAGAFVEVDNAAAIPLYRLVHVQLEREVREAAGIPHALRQGRVLSAVWRVAPCRRSTGTPGGYALRFLVDPHQHDLADRSDSGMAVAS